MTYLSKYAFLLTKRDQYPLAEEVLRHAMQSVVFQEPHPADSLRMALIGIFVFISFFLSSLT